MTDRESEAPVGPGDVLAGKYKVERVLGVGGMGVVVQALHLELDERVAVKFLLPKSIESPEAAARFVREARAAVRIKSEHVVRVSDVGRLDDGAPYIVMEYLEGKDLSALIDDGAIAVEDAVDYVLQACVAMAEAHRLDIVHRDLKPSNLFLTRRSDGYPIVKVLDFGISKVKANDTGEAGLTKTATPMGSPYYMSPEQLRSAKDVDHRTDIWALGTILFELMTLMPPFQAETMPQLVAAILAEPPMSLEKLAPSVPAGLRAVVARCLEKDRERRYADIAALAQALAPFAPARSRHLTERLSHAAGSASLDASGASATSAPEVTFNEAPTRLGEELGAGTDTAWIGPQDEKPRASRKWMLGGGAAAVALVGVLAFLAFERAKETASPATSAVAAPNGGVTVPNGVAAETAPRGNAPPVVVPEPDALPTSPASSAPSVVPVPPVVPVNTPLVASATPAPPHAAATAPRTVESPSHSGGTLSRAVASPSRPAKSTPTPAAATPAPKSQTPAVPAPPVAAGVSAPAPVKADPEPPKPKKNPLAVDLK